MNVGNLRETTATKVSNRPRNKDPDWLLKELDRLENHDFVSMTVLAEFLFNSHYPVEGFYVYMASATSWNVLAILESGYVHDLCVKFVMSFPLNYPDVLPVIRVAYPAKLTHPLIDRDTGQIDLKLLLRDMWNPIEMCSIHILGALKGMLMSPCIQPYKLNALSDAANKAALEEYLQDPNVTLRWRTDYIESLKQGLAKATPPSTEKEELDYHIDALNVGETYPPSLGSLNTRVCKVLKKFDSTLQGHVDIMVERIRSDSDVSMLKLVQERVSVIHQDLQALSTSS